MALNFDAQLQDYERKVHAVCLFYPGTRPSNPVAVGLRAPGEQPMTEPTPEQRAKEARVRADVQQRLRLHRELVRGSGFSTVPGPLPFVNLLDFDDEDFVTCLLQEALPADRDRFRQYLSKMPLGLGAITAVSVCICDCTIKANV